MKNYIIHLLLLLLVTTMVSCQTHSEWAEIRIDAALKCDSLATECTSEHQGEHEVKDCKVYFDGDTLVLLFPAALPAYWGGTEIKVYNGRFNARFNGIPFAPVKLSFETISQKLSLNKTHYATGDTLCGYCDFVFSETDVASGQIYKFRFKGNICEIIRPQDFNPYDKANYMTFDLPTALNELGEPMSRELIDMTMLPGEFGVELMNYFPVNKNILIEEVTWDLGEIEESGYSFEKRLTIWYARTKDRTFARKDLGISLPPVWNRATNDNLKWLPVDDCQWHTGIQF